MLPPACQLDYIAATSHTDAYWIIHVSVCRVLDLYFYSAVLSGSVQSYHQQLVLRQLHSCRRPSSAWVSASSSPAASAQRPPAPLYCSAQRPPAPLYCLGPSSPVTSRLSSASSSPAASTPLPGSARPPSAPVLPPPLLGPGPLNLYLHQLLQSCSAAPAVDNERTAPDRLFIPTRA